MRKKISVLLSAAVMAGMLMAPVMPGYAEEAEQTVEEAAESAEESMGGAVTDGGDIVIASSLDGVTLPENSEQFTYNYKGEAVQAAKTKEGLILLPVVTTDDDGGDQVIWYVYNENTEVAIPYARFNNALDSFVILSPDDDVEIPEEFVSVPIALNGGIVCPAYRNQLVKEDDMYIIYAMNSSGTPGFYRFDGSNGLLVRYVEDLTFEATTEPTTTEAPTDDPVLVSQIEDLRGRSAAASVEYDVLNKDHEEKMLYGLIIIIGLGALCLILLLIIAIVASKLRSARRDAEEAEERAEKAQKENASQHRNRLYGDSQGGRPRRTPRQTEDSASRSMNPRRSTDNAGTDTGFSRSSTTSEVKRVSRRSSPEVTDIMDEAPKRRSASRSSQERKTSREDRGTEKKDRDLDSMKVPETRSRRRKEVENGNVEDVWAGTGPAEEVSVDLTERVGETANVATETVDAADNLFVDFEEAPEEDFDITDFKDI